MKVSYIYCHYLHPDSESEALAEPAPPSPQMKQSLQRPKPAVRLGNLCQVVKPKMV